MPWDEMGRTQKVFLSHTTIKYESRMINYFLFREFKKIKNKTKPLFSQNFGENTLIKKV